MVMADLVAFLITAGGLAAVLSALMWLARRVRARGIGGAIVGVADEIYNPAAHRSRFDIQAQAQRAVALPSPDAGGPDPTPDDSRQ